MNAKNYYNLIADTYDSNYLDPVSSAEDTIVKTILSDYISTGSNVLDCGCGTGLAKDMLSGKRCKYTGLDISENMLKVAKSKYPNERFILGDMRSMPFIQNNSYDYVISINGSFSHVVNCADSIREVDRILKPGGKFFIMVYSRYSIKRILKFKFIRTTGNYKIRNFYGSSDIQTPAIFWSVRGLKNAFRSFNEINITGLNLLADFFKERIDFNVAHMLLANEIQLPLWLQQLSHALIIQGKK